MNLLCPLCKTKLKLSIIEVIPIDEEGNDDIEHGPSKIEALKCLKCKYWEYVEFGVVN